MTKKYKAIYTVSIYETKEVTFSDGTTSKPNWLSPYDLHPNKIQSQVFEDIESEIPTIVQIGSNDGVSGEYYGLLPYLESLEKFRLFLIEPQKKYINYLKDIYGHLKGEVNYLNNAITETTGQFSMTDRQNCAQIVDSNTNNFINSANKITVDGITWNDLLNQYSIDKVDILLMDCEGYELNIMKQFKQSGILPKNIRYEYPHFNNPSGVDGYLKNMGYAIQYCRTDPCWDKVAILGGEEVEYEISQVYQIPKNKL